jgi:hypothetical protein
VRYCAGAVGITTKLPKDLSLMLNKIHETARSQFMLAFGQELNISTEYMKLQCDVKCIRKECTRNTMKSKLGAKG